MWDSECPNLVTVSVYDTKPVFFSTDFNITVWLNNKSLMWIKSMVTIVLEILLRLCINDECNNGMNGVDISDQLQKQCIFDIWMQKKQSGSGPCYYGN